MVLNPSLDEKEAILRNVLAACRSIGIDTPKVGILSAVEKVNAKMQDTIDAQELKSRADCGNYGRSLVEGPISFDLAYDRRACLAKNYQSPVGGDVDALLVPNITVGNVLGKSLVHAAGGTMAGFIAGAAAPIILTSRSSSSEEKLNSLAISALVANQQRRNSHVGY